LGQLKNNKKFYLKSLCKKKKKDTLGITALLFWRVLIDKIVCDLDVELMNLFDVGVK